MTEYEYAGFRYRMVEEGGRFRAIPLPGQHPAASKDRHRRNAESQFAEEKKT